MSVATRRAIYGKLAGDTTLNGYLGTPPTGYSKSIFYQQAPQGARFPYVIFQKQAGTPRYAIGEKAYDDEVWLVKGVDRSTDADVADAISSRIDALLTDGTISISGNTQLYLRRTSDIDFAETTDGVRYLHSGALFRLVYDAT
jgi:hypothetical protein